MDETVSNKINKIQIELCKIKSNNYAHLHFISKQYNIVIVKVLFEFKEEKLMMVAQSL